MTKIGDTYAKSKKELEAMLAFAAQYGRVVEVRKHRSQLCIGMQPVPIDSGLPKQGKADRVTVVCLWLAGTLYVPTYYDPHLYAGPGKRYYTDAHLKKLGAREVQRELWQRTDIPALATRGIPDLSPGQRKAKKEGK